MQMKKPELLCPAGNMESLKQAIHNGADAVYLGVKVFGARKFANNFDNEQIIEAIKLCHLYDVKLYVTMNTLIKNSEVNDFLAEVEYLYKNGVDAILMQDFGMISIVREMFPKLEIHASTQANNSSIDIAKLFNDMGVKRIVLSRELTIDQIKSINVPIEKEVFIHGALCICYSGCCLMSSMIGGRSGNRGECAGSCRLPYSLEYKSTMIDNGKYLISTKELNSSTKIKELMNSDISSLKIEGRMKSPEYVGFITKYYRNLIDNNIDNLEEETDKLKTIFNREFTIGHLFNVSPADLINKKTPNHIGLEIGKVIDVNEKKIKIKLNKELNQEDGIRFIESGKGMIVNFLYDEKDKLISKSNTTCYIDNKIGLTTLDIVSKTQDFKLNNKLKTYLNKKIKVEIEVTAKINEKLSITIHDNKNKITVYGNVVSKSINSPTSKERIIQQIEKIKDTPFECDKITIHNDLNIFIPIKQINELRRKVINDLINKRTEINIEVVKNKIEFNINLVKQSSKIYTSVKTEEQLLKCLELNVGGIYIDDEQLYKKYKTKEKIYYKLPRCMFNIMDNIKDRMLINDYFTFKNDSIGDYGLNVYNIYTAYYLYKLGLKRITLSNELNMIEINQFIKDFQDTFKCYPNIEIMCYGRVENMIIKDNILSLKTNDFNYYLIDLRKRKFPTYFDGNNTHILNYEDKNEIVDNYIKNNSNLRLDFYNENSKKVEEIVNRYL